MRRLAAGLLAGAMLTVSGCSGSPAASSPPPTPSPVALEELPVLKLEATVSGFTGALAVLSEDGAIWVLDHSHPSVSRIDPKTNEVTTAVQLGSGNASGLGLAGGRLWTFHQSTGEAIGIDPSTGAIRATVPAGHDGDFFWIGDDAAWVLTGETLVRIDGATSKATSLPFDSTCGVAGAAAGGGFLWVASAGGALCKIDEHSGTVVSRGSGAGIGAGLAVVGGELWVPAEDGSLVVLDPASLSVSTTVPPPPNGTFQGARYAIGQPGENAVVVGGAESTTGWVRYNGGTVARVTISGTPGMDLFAGFPPDLLPGRVVEAFGSLWVANFGAGTVERYALPAS
jgi:streptogramin lyase